MPLPKRPAHCDRDGPRLWRIVQDRYAPWLLGVTKSSVPLSPTRQHVVFYEGTGPSFRHSILFPGVITGPTSDLHSVVL